MMKRPRRGHAVIELTFFMPWVYFLFVGALDFGFYSYSLIAVQNAARAAGVTLAQYRALSSDQAEACRQVRADLSKLPNAGSFNTSCSSDPLRVTVTPFTDAEGRAATRVAVSYRTIRLLQIPYLIPGQLTINRTVEFRVYGD